LFCCFIEVTMTVVKSVSDGLRDCESETQLNLNRTLGSHQAPGISAGPCPTFPPMLTGLTQLPHWALTWGVVEEQCAADAVSAKSSPLSLSPMSSCARQAPCTGPSDAPSTTSAEGPAYVQGEMRAKSQRRFKGLGLIVSKRNT
jgi:hypothetical protein